MPQKLNPRQKKFIKEYLIDLNATQAAERAGYSKKTAAVQAARLLTNVKIQEEIQKRQEKLQEKTDLTIETILKEYSTIALHGIDRDHIKPQDKIKALDSIAKILGFFNNADNSKPVVNINIDKDDLLL